MKKNLLWMLAAILLCGTMTTSCSKDDDNKIDDTPSTTANTYEVTIAALLPRSAAPYLQVKVDYTDAEGKSETVIVKEGDQSQTLGEIAKARYVDVTSEYRLKPEYIQILDDLIVRNITFKVPAGKSFEFKGTIVTRTDYTTPTDDVTIVQPCVISSAKRISGNSKDRSELATNGNLSVIANFGIDAEKFASMISRWNGRDIGSGSVTMN